MQSIINKGEKYYRLKGTWVDESFIIVPTAVQKDLNRAYFDQYLYNFQTLEYKKIREEAKFFKDNASPDIAMEMLQYLYDKLHDRKQSLKSLLSMMTSCYRMVGQPEKAVALYREVNAIYGSGIESADLMTSVAAAFLDVKNCEQARKCCNKAYAMSSGKQSDELRSVYQRYKSECSIIF